MLVERNKLRTELREARETIDLLHAEATERCHAWAADLERSRAEVAALRREFTQTLAAIQIVAEGGSAPLAYTSAAYDAVCDLRRHLDEARALLAAGPVEVTAALLARIDKLQAQHAADAALVARLAKALQLRHSQVHTHTPAVGECDACDALAAARQGASVPHAAEWIVTYGLGVEDYTHSCSQHLGEMMTDAKEHRIYPTDNPDYRCCFIAAADQPSAQETP